MGRAVRKGPLGHKISKMSFHRHVIVKILKNFGVQTVFWNSTPKCPKRGIEKKACFAKIRHARGHLVAGDLKRGERQQCARSPGTLIITRISIL